MKATLKGILFLGGILAAGIFSSQQLNAQDILTEVRNIVVSSGGTSPYIKFDVFISGTSTYVSNVNSSANKALSNVDIAYDVDFGTLGSAAAGTNAPIVASSYSATGIQAVANSVTPSNLSGAMPSGYDSRFKMNMDRVTTNNAITTTPVKAFTFQVNYPASTLIDQSTGSIRLRTTTGGTGSKWGSFDATIIGAPIGPSASQVQPLAVVALPIELTEFTANNNGDGRALLNWATASEQNTASFHVERSVDGADFSTVVATVRAAGKSSSLLKYQSYDNAPVTGANYYRLKMIDLSGKYSYSEVRKVIFAGDRKAQVSVYPTDSRDGIVYVSLPTGYEHAQINVLNAAGQLMQAPVEGAAQVRTVRLSGLPAGMYMLHVADKSSTQTFRVSYQH